jgi:hypothetical protein
VQSIYRITRGCRACCKKQRSEKKENDFFVYFFSSRVSSRCLLSIFCLPVSPYPCFHWCCSLLSIRLSDFSIFHSFPYICLSSTLSEKLECLFFSLGYFRAISWTYMTNISEKYSPLCGLLSFKKYFGFFRTSTFRDIWQKIPRLILKIVCWLTLDRLHQIRIAWLV